MRFLHNNYLLKRINYLSCELDSPRRRNRCQYNRVIEWPYANYLCINQFICIWNWNIMYNFQKPSIAGHQIWSAVLWIQCVGRHIIYWVEANRWSSWTGCIHGFKRPLAAGQKSLKFFHIHPEVIRRSLTQTIESVDLVR